jgi:hypothetical protein
VHKHDPAGLRLAFLAGDAAHSCAFIARLSSFHAVLLRVFLKPAVFS